MNLETEQKVILLKQNKLSYRAIAKAISDSGTPIKKSMVGVIVNKYKNNPSLLVSCQTGTKSKPQPALIKKDGRDKMSPPKIKDTRSMGWYDWVYEYFGEKLLDSQIKTLEDIEKYARYLKNKPRRSGKTNFILRFFIIRKLGESQFEHIKQGVIAYLSSARDVIIELMDDIANIFEDNEKIKASYGELMDNESRNTQTIINLTTRKNRNNPSMKGGTLQSRWRGLGFRWLIIDDPIDYFHESEIESLTKKLVKAIRGKLAPIAKHGSICILGTRYSIRDLFAVLDDNEGKQKTWRWHSEKTVEKWGSYSVPPRDIPIKPSEILIHDVNEWIINDVVLWENLPRDPEATGIQQIVWEYLDTSDREFSSEYQNDPRLLFPVIDYGKITPIATLSRGLANYKWTAFVDVSVSEKSGGDYTAVTLTACLNKQYFIYDMFWGKWSSSKKYKRIEDEQLAWEEEIGFRIPLLVEVVMNNGAELYQWLRDETELKVSSVNPKGRGTKTNRITVNLQQQIDEGRVFILDSCRYKEHLEGECNSFPNSKNDHILDSLDQAIWNLKKQTSYVPMKAVTVASYRRNR